MDDEKSTKQEIPIWHLHWFNAKQASAYLSIATSLFYKLVREKKIIPNGSVGSLIRISRTQLDRCVRIPIEGRTDENNIETTERENAKSHTERSAHQISGDQESRPWAISYPNPVGGSSNREKTKTRMHARRNPRGSTRSPTSTSCSENAGTQNISKHLKDEISRLRRELDEEA